MKIEDMFPRGSKLTNLKLSDNDAKIDVDPVMGDAFIQSDKRAKMIDDIRDEMNKSVKEIVDATATEESKNRFKIKDRKELAKLLTGLKEQKKRYKVSRSLDEGYRYAVQVFEDLVPEENIEVKNEEEIKVEDKPEIDSCNVEISVKDKHEDINEVLDSCMTVGALKALLSDVDNDDCKIVIKSVEGDKEFYSPFNHDLVQGFHHLDVDAGVEDTAEELPDVEINLEEERKNEFIPTEKEKSVGYVLNSSEARSIINRNYMNFKKLKAELIDLLEKNKHEDNIEAFEKAVDIIRQTRSMNNLLSSITGYLTGVNVRKHKETVKEGVEMEPENQAEVLAILDGTDWMPLDYVVMVLSDENIELIPEQVEAVAENNDYNVITVTELGWPEYKVVTKMSKEELYNDDDFKHDILQFR